MSGHILPSGRRYSFEVDMEIDNSLGLTPGELSAFLLDALFDLDHQGLLFPGITEPKAGARVLSGSVAPTGYRRGVNQGTYTAAHRNPGMTPEARSSDETALYDELEAVWFPLEDLFKEQRMFQAKLLGLLDQLRSADPLSDADRQRAGRLLKASQNLIRRHGKSIKPLL